jgi:hypothetical protein
LCHQLQSPDRNVVWQAAWRLVEVLKQDPPRTPTRRKSRR